MHISLRYAGAALPCTHCHVMHANLKSMRLGTGNQCSCFRIGVMCFRTALAPVMAKLIVIDDSIIPDVCGIDAITDASAKGR